ncbi:uncharacterized protein J3R85_004726 [Psidium guajava]|nr:uncharacterized protein J3R85_004726 [Psidium guajava]
MKGARKNIPWFKTFFSFLASPVSGNHRRHHIERTAPEAAIVAASKHFSAPPKLRLRVNSSFTCTSRSSKAASRRRRRTKEADEVGMVTFSWWVAAQKIRGRGEDLVMVHQATVDS